MICNHRLLGAALLSVAAVAGAGTRQDSVPDSAHTSLSNAYPNTAFILTTPSFGGGSGVLISPQWVLTAAHVIDDQTDATVVFSTNGINGWANGESYEVDQVIPHPSWNGTIGGGFDIGLLHLSGPTGANSPPLPTPAVRYTGSGEVGQAAVFTGFGAQGTGSAGHVNPLLFDFNRRAGENLISITANQDPSLLNHPQLFNGNATIAAQYFVSDFDDPPAQPQGSDTNNAYYSSLDPLPLEYSTAPGDSGGGVFANFGSGPELIGINTWIHGYFDGTDNASYGDIFAATRVSLFNDWINQVTGIPEPTAPALAGVAALLILQRRRRRRDGHDVRSLR